MREFIKQYQNPNEDRINYKLINREYDKPLIEYINDSAKSLEVLKNIEFIGSEFVEFESQIDNNKYEKRRKSKDKKNKQEIKYMNMEDSRVGELILKFKITFKGETEIIEKPILIPLPDEDGYYQIKGKRYILMYQLVDASTYVNKQSVVLKSIMPIFLTRRSCTKKDTEGVEYTRAIYTTKVFKNDINIMYFYFAKIGFDNTMKYLMVERYISLTNKVVDTEEYIYFKISDKFYLKVIRRIFESSAYVSSVAFMILAICNSKVNAENIDSKYMWLEKIGGIFSISTNQYEKGKNILIFLDRMLDETTKSTLRIDEIHKKSMYSILRWQLQNFNELKKKDNMDMANKRLRDSEYIASLLNQELSRRLLPAINSGRKLSKEKIKDVFKFPGEILISQLYRSGLFRYDDQVNDMDFFSKLRFTTKGPNSLGGKNTNSLSASVRGLHPSMLGRIDLNVVGTSDPGTGGVLTPFCETHGLYFSDKVEPEAGKFNLEKENAKFDGENGAMVIDCFESFDEYKDFENKITNLGNMRLTSTPKEDTDKLYINIKMNQDDEL
jgi:hypothetical protein